ncbi:hypothetical protein BDB01DRAFT_748067 [Pilobolus umbonatus]|nr:hypothetical protein BDB01DRAFT_748067 [Pilobolus umbonatus]
MRFYSNNTFIITSIIKQENISMNLNVYVVPLIHINVSIYLSMIVHQGIYPQSKRAHSSSRCRDI